MNPLFQTSFTHRSRSASCACKIQQHVLFFGVTLREKNQCNAQTVFPSPLTHTVFVRHVSTIPVVLRIDPSHASY